MKEIKSSPLYTDPQYSEVEFLFFPLSTIIGSISDLFQSVMVRMNVPYTKEMDSLIDRLQKELFSVQNLC